MVVDLIISLSIVLIVIDSIYAQPCKNITDLLVTPMFIGSKEYANVSFTIDSITDPNMTKNLLEVPHPDPICISLPQNITYKGINISTGISNNIYIMNSHTTYIQNVLPDTTLIGDTSDIRQRSLSTRCKSDYINQQARSWNISSKDISVRSLNGIDATIYRNPSAFGVELLIVFGDPLSTDGAMCNHVGIGGMSSFRLLSEKYSYSTTLSLKYKNESLLGTWNNTSSYLALGSFAKILLTPSGSNINGFPKWTLITDEGAMIDSFMTAPPGECLALDKVSWLRGITKVDLEGCLIHRLPFMSNILKKADGRYFDNTIDFVTSSVFGARFPTFPYQRITYEYDSINGIRSELNANYRATFTLQPIEVIYPVDNTISSTSIFNRNDTSNNNNTNGNVNSAYIRFSASYMTISFLIFSIRFLF